MGTTKMSNEGYCIQMCDMYAPAGAASGPSALREELTRISLGHSIERLMPFKKKERNSNGHSGGLRPPHTESFAFRKTWGILIVVNGYF